jgi:molecular chaperone GrpE (heat shock protein)
MNWRGRYEGGGEVFTAKYWWSPDHRRHARMAAWTAELQQVRADFERFRERYERQRQGLMAALDRASTAAVEGTVNELVAALEEARDVLNA